MRSKMLGLAIALATFGLGVAATTVWIAYHTPNEPAPPLTRTYTTETYETRVYGADSTPFALPTPFPHPKGMTIMGGVLNSKAISKPAPVYPQVARAAQVSGTVIVQITVDESGRVISAKPISGNPLLGQAATQAAYNWRFSPTLLYGQPFKVTGTITFNFLLQ